MALSLPLVTLMGTGAAVAATKTVHYRGLFVYDDGKLAGEIDRTTSGNNLFQKLTSDPNGDRMSVKAPVRDLMPENGRSVYPQVNWAKNGSYCYVSGLSIGKGGGSGSVGCSNGWNGYGQTRARDMADSGWWFYRMWKGFDLNSNSVRGALKICEDISWRHDPCSDYRFGGVSY